ncbi:unnamed protein product, partial [Sphenostylis stenocarpa]
GTRARFCLKRKWLLRSSPYLLNLLHEIKRNIVGFLKSIRVLTSGQIVGAWIDQ